MNRSTGDRREWPQAWVRASLELAILSALERADLHGYAIAALLGAAGMGRLKGGSLYPVLARLEQAGFVAAVWQPGEQGPGRKAYAITPAGRAERESLWRAWNDLTSTLAALTQSTPAAVETQEK